MFGLGAILTVIKFVPNAVRLVERLFRDKSGPDKQNAAVDIITSVLPLLGVDEDREHASTELIEGISLLINGTVKVLHAVGEFRHQEDEIVAG